jgi:hypothetical protein
MARRVFFPFHYAKDVQRAHVVRNSWVTKPDREEAGFFDSSVFEASKRNGDAALKRFLDEGLKGSSVTAVLFGADTVWRRWVRYEILRSFLEGKGSSPWPSPVYRDGINVVTSKARTPLPIWDMRSPAESFDPRNTRLRVSGFGVLTFLASS